MKDVGIGRSYNTVFYRYSEELTGEVDNWNGGDRMEITTKKIVEGEMDGEKIQRKPIIKVEIIIYHA